MLSWNLDLLSSTEILVLWRSLFFLVSIVENILRFRASNVFARSRMLQEFWCWWKWDRNKLLMVHSDDYL